MKNMTLPASSVVTSAVVVSGPESSTLMEFPAAALWFSPWQSPVCPTVQAIRRGLFYCHSDYTDSEETVHVRCSSRR